MFSRKPKPARRSFPQRHLITEALEDRRMMATFSPTTEAELIAAVTAATGNGEADMIDLGGQTFTFTTHASSLSDRSALPVIKADSGHNLQILNGTIERGVTAASFRLIHVAPDASLSLSGVTLRGGSVNGNGGALFVENGSAFLFDSVVTGNSAVSKGGAIYANLDSNDILSIQQSTISNNRTTSTSLANTVGGGGVYLRSSGLAEIRNSTIAGNSTGSRGGGLRLYSSGRTDIHGSTFSGNQAGLYGGGMYLGNLGNGATDIVNSTVSGNQSEYNGGGILAGRGVTLAHSTVTNNTADVDGDGGGRGGGIYARVGTLTLDHSIVAGNNLFCCANSDIVRHPSAGGVANFSLFQDSAAALAFLGGSNNRFGADPLLVGLADNGGPTQTHAFASTLSPAFDAGSPNVVAPPSFDQRGTGFPRLLGTVDIGAYEGVGAGQIPETLEVSTIDDLVDGDLSAGDLSLREAVVLANSVFFPGADTITFAPALFSTEQTISLAHGEIEITEPLTIEGPGRSLLTVSGQDLSRVFNITSTTGDFAFEGLTLTDGFESGIHYSDDDDNFSGGAIRSVSTGALTITAATLSGNRVEGHHHAGGAIFAKGPVNISGSILQNNSAIGQSAGERAHGGAIRSFGSVTIEDSVVSSNRVTGHGGAIYADGDATITSGTLQSNTAELDGGALRALGDATLTDSSVSGNLSHLRGGAVRANDLVIEASRLSQNRSMDDGGAVFGSVVSITTSEIWGNTADVDGGAIFALDDVAITASTIRSNRSFEDGGAVNGRRSITIERSTLHNNDAAGAGGAIYTRSAFPSQVTVTQSTISGNDATGSGGGVFSFWTVVVENSTVTANVSGYDGGGIWGNELELRDSIVAGNAGLAGTHDWRFGNTLTTTCIFGGGANPTFPQLAALADNGGVTQTHMPLPGSPVIDLCGTPPVLPQFDQRGAPYLRLSGSGLDAGAIEVQPEPVTCDLDGDGICDSVDLDLLINEIAAGTNSPGFDLTADGFVTLADRDEWLTIAGAMNLASGNAYLLGDANLDGTVDGQDFLAWNANKFTSVAAWTAGDFNADGVVDGQDFIVWNTHKFLSADRAVDAAEDHRQSELIQLVFERFSEGAADLGARESQ